MVYISLDLLLSKQNGKRKNEDEDVDSLFQIQEKSLDIFVTYLGRFIPKYSVIFYRI